MDLIYKFYGVDWAAMIFSFIQIYLLSQKNAFGFIFGICASICWFIFGLLTGSVANLVANTAFFILNCRGYYKWRQDDV